MPTSCPTFSYVLGLTHRYRLQVLSAGFVPPSLRTHDAKEPQQHRGHFYEGREDGMAQAI